ncbi:hypothetical protein B0H67DRAFT_138502 [Lasiosphaeris hirsuta]|uniref:Uncharacterized protein n=1 Tax=Lasiosphaeris hirsuta TaxID=260670 RepID=A0AA40B123_9PEZI|nr:hypothetical protein B0H67DRAFT_138502 [Lasiosphaeris hirsuta]
MSTIRSPGFRLSLFSRPWRFRPLHPQHFLPRHLPPYPRESRSRIMAGNGVARAGPGRWGVEGGILVIHPYAAFPITEAWQIHKPRRIDKERVSFIGPLSYTTLQPLHIPFLCPLVREPMPYLSLSPLSTAARSVMPPAQGETSLEPLQPSTPATVTPTRCHPAMTNKAGGGGGGIGAGPNGWPNDGRRMRVRCVCLLFMLRTSEGPGRDSVGRFLQQRQDQWHNDERPLPQMTGFASESAAGVPAPGARNLSDGKAF